MIDRFKWCDNFGVEVPTIDTGLEAIPQPNLQEQNLLKLQDPEGAGAWIVSDTWDEVRD